MLWKAAKDGLLDGLVLLRRDRCIGVGSSFALFHRQMAGLEKDHGTLLLEMEVSRARGPDPRLQDVPVIGTLTRKFGSICLISANTWA